MTGRQHRSSGAFLCGSPATPPLPIGSAMMHACVRSRAERYRVDRLLPSGGRNFIQQNNLGVKFADSPVEDWHLRHGPHTRGATSSEAQPMKIDTKHLLPVILLAALGLAAAVPVLGQQKAAAPPPALSGTISGRVLEKGKDPVPY